MAKQQPKQSNKLVDEFKSHGKRPSRAKQHGRTYCAYCTKKIAFGNAFCNSKCRAAYSG